MTLCSSSAALIAPAELPEMTAHHIDPSTGEDELAMVNAATGKASQIGKAAIYANVDVAPDGNHLLVVSNHRPFSYSFTANSFPREVEVWDHSGKLVHKFASLPLQDQIPIEGVATGPRNYNWRPTEPATLVWVEALDGGDHAG